MNLPFNLDTHVAIILNSKSTFFHLSLRTGPTYSSSTGVEKPHQHLELLKQAAAVFSRFYVALSAS